VDPVAADGWALALEGLKLYWLKLRWLKGMLPIATNPHWQRRKGTGRGRSLPASALSLNNFKNHLSGVLKK
jgi:hypothetical protein